MNFSELVKIRQSVRKYLAKAVEPEKLEIILESARLAPSASNSQPWKIIVVNEKELLRKTALATFDSIVSFNKFLLEAPVILVIVIEKPKFITQAWATIKKREFPLIDIGIIAEHICLQAADLGLGSCMIGWFNEKKIKKLLNIPFRKRIGLLISLGYPPEDYKLREKIRKSKAEIISYNQYKP